MAHIRTLQKEAARLGVRIELDSNWRDFDTRRLYWVLADSAQGFEWCSVGTRSLDGVEWTLAQLAKSGQSNRFLVTALHAADMCPNRSPRSNFAPHRKGRTLFFDACAHVAVFMTAQSVKAEEITPCAAHVAEHFDSKRSTYRRLSGLSRGEVFGDFVNYGGENG